MNLKSKIRTQNESLTSVGLRQFVWWIWAPLHFPRDKLFVIRKKYLLFKEEIDNCWMLFRNNNIYNSIYEPLNVMFQQKKTFDITKFYLYNELHQLGIYTKMTIENVQIIILVSPYIYIYIYIYISDIWETRFIM